MKKRIDGSWVQSSDTFPVKVGEIPILQEKTVEPSEQEQEVTADGIFTGLGKVVVGAIPDQYIIPSGSQTITENGEVDVKSLASVNVAIPFSTIYYGSDTPNASFGNDGDIYIKR